MLIKFKTLELLAVLDLNVSLFVLGYRLLCTCITVTLHRYFVADLSGVLLKSKSVMLVIAKIVLSSQYKLLGCVCLWDGRHQAFPVTLEF